MHSHRGYTQSLKSLLCPAAVEGRKRLSKRPAVAARKAKALGLPAPKQLTEKQKLRKQKARKYLEAS